MGAVAATSSRRVRCRTSHGGWKPPLRRPLVRRTYGRRPVRRHPKIIQPLPSETGRCRSRNCYHCLIQRYCAMAAWGPCFLCYSFAFPVKLLAEIKFPISYQFSYQLISYQSVRASQRDSCCLCQLFSLSRSTSRQHRSAPAARHTLGRRRRVVARLHRPVPNPGGVWRVSVLRCRRE